MRKTFTAVTAVALALALAACYPPTDPPPQRPDSIPAGRPFHPPPHREGLASGSFWAWLEDANGAEIVHDVTITIDGFANGPDGQRDFTWDDTGMSGQLPLEMVRRAPFDQPVHWEPGKTVILAVTVIFEDAQFGDKVVCWQDDANGVPKPGSERFTERQATSRGTISVNCNFIFH